MTCSPETEVKQEHFAKIIDAHLRIVRGIFGRSPWAHPEYLYFDLNAGSGRGSGDYEEITGSPLLFVDAAERIGIGYRAYFFERNRENAEELKVHLAERSLRFGHVTIVHGDHRETVEGVAEALKLLAKPMYGLIYADPYGADIPVDVINTILSAPIRDSLDKMDVLVSLSATSLKRVAQAAARTSGEAHDKPRMLELLGRIGKKQLWLREPYGKWQWTFAILTDWADFPTFDGLRLREFGTPAGDELAKRLNLTRGEIRQESQPAIPFLLSGPIAPMPSTCGTPNSALSEPKPCDAHPVGANGAGTVEQLKFTIFDTQNGEPSMFPKIS